MRTNHLSIIILFALLLSLSSCAFHNGLTTNINEHTTQVVLSKNNYKVVSAVQGTSSTTYVFGIGGLSKKAMIAEAKAKMLRSAKIVGGSRAVINETVEIQKSFFPIVRTYRVTVSGHVIEFTN